ncbi:MFS transporter [Ensifer sp. Root31]|uniref:MFS transporter n=1 Tax=Ensifer sp. Root31 TaxID=1736512 RepID=UPI0007C75506|nr:MFS transporter [Ensifer sp. Root31]
MNEHGNGGRIFLLTAVVALSLNLRPIVAAVGPLADIITKSAQITSTEIGLFTTLPVLLMGIGAMCAKHLRSSFGEIRGITIGALAIVLGCLGRAWFTTGGGLLITAALAGSGIAVVQALAPGFIKRNFGTSTGRVIGFYSTGIVTGAAISSATASSFAEKLGWPLALAFWCGPALAGVALWIAASRSANGAIAPSTVVQGSQVSFWRFPRSWSLLVFFGIGTGAFMLVMSWLPPFYLELGASRVTSGYLVAGLTLVEAVTALVLSASIHRFPDRRVPLCASLVTIFAGLVCLLVAPLPLAIPAIVLLGIGIGILFPLSIIVAIDHINDPTQAGDFTAFVQGGGYVIASFVPLVAGSLRDAFASLTHAWMLMAVCIAGLLILAIRYSPASYRAFRDKIAARNAAHQFTATNDRRVA